MLGTQGAAPQPTCCGDRGSGGQKTPPVSARDTWGLTDKEGSKSPMNLQHNPGFVPHSCARPRSSPPPPTSHTQIYTMWVRPGPNRHRAGAGGTAGFSGPAKGSGAGSQAGGVCRARCAQSPVGTHTGPTSTITLSRLAIFHPFSISSNAN